MDQAQGWMDYKRKGADMEVGGQAPPNYLSRIQHLADESKRARKQASKEA